MGGTLTWPHELEDCKIPFARKKKEWLPPPSLESSLADKPLKLHAFKLLTDKTACTMPLIRVFS